MGKRYVYINIIIIFIFIFIIIFIVIFIIIGDRKDEFRGAPAICRQYCNNGIIAVAPSYRLNNSNHMEDAVNAVLWVIKNSSILGANPNSIFISGHSAGN